MTTVHLTTNHDSTLYDNRDNAIKGVSIKEQIGDRTHIELLIVDLGPDSNVKMMEFPFDTCSFDELRMDNPNAGGLRQQFEDVMNKNGYWIWDHDGSHFIYRKGVNPNPRT